MKKSLFIILMVCLAIVGLVSCKNEIEPAQEELVSVSFENGSSRALTATLEDFDVTKYYWAYEAKKNDGSGLKSGETAWETETIIGTGSVPVRAGQLGLGNGKPTDTDYEAYKVPNFSKGYWNFRLFAYTTCSGTGSTADPYVYSGLVYWGEVDSVLIDSKHHLASVTVSPVSGGNGYLAIGEIELVPAEGGTVTDLIVYSDKIQKLNDNNQWVDMDPQPSLEQGRYTLSAGQYKFIREYSFAGIPVGNGSVIATVYAGLTTTVSGTLSELTTYAQFGAEQNPDIITKTAGVDGIHKNDNVSDYYTLTEKDPTAEDVKVTAKVPAAAAKNLLPKDPVTEQPIADASMSLNLNVDTVDSTSTSVTYEISMTKIVTLNSEVTTSDVTTLGEDSQNKKYYATAEVKLSAGLTDVKVTHDQREMTSGQQWAAAAQMDLTPANFIAYAGTETDPDVDGYYYYYEYTEENVKKATLYIKTNTFSPFEVTYKLTDAVAAVISKDKYKEYSSLAAAIDAAEAGETVILLSDVTSKVGYIIDKDLSIDTNGKTITVTEGSDADSHRAFKVTNGKLSVYGGGTIDAKGQATKSTGTEGTGCYGAFRAEVDTELYLKDITLKNYRPWGLNVKVLGANAELDNVKIYSVCGGGIEVTDDEGAAGTVRGYAKLTNCEMTQSEWRDWCSVAVSASGNSTVDVYSTSYEGEYGVYVFSSGGTINIYGGSFIANGTYGEAGEPKQVLKAAVDRATYPSAEAKINVFDGCFEGTYAIQDSDYVKLTITGGTFDHDPSAYVAEGYIANKIATDKWEVVEFLPGSGTEVDPYIIEDIDAWMLLVKCCEYDSTYSVTEGKYFEMTNDIDVSSKTVRATVHYFAGHIDFGGNTLCGFNGSNMVDADIPDGDLLVAVFPAVKGNVSFKNLKFNISTVSYGTTAALTMLSGRLYGNNSSILFENITTEGIATGVMGNNNGPLFCYAVSVSGISITCKNCTNNATIVGSGYRSAFIGNASYMSGSTISFVNCVNNGLILTTGPAAMLIGNGNNYTATSDSPIAITVTNCVNNGRIIGSGAGDGKLLIDRVDSRDVFTVNGKTWAEYKKDTTIDDNLSGNPGETITASVIDVTGGCFVLTKTDDAAYYQLQFAFSASSHAGGNVGYLIEFGNSTTPFDSEKDLPSDIAVSSWVDDETKVGEVTSYQPTNSTAGTLYLDASEHYVFNEQGSRLRDKVFVTFIAYGSNNEILSIKTYQY